LLAETGTLPAKYRPHILHSSLIIHHSPLPSFFLFKK